MASPINEPGGTFDFGTLPLDQADRMEFVRGAQSTLYGSDAMTSVVQVWTRAGSTPMPELRFGADGGNFSDGAAVTRRWRARGAASITTCSATNSTPTGAGINNAFSDSLQGANVGAAINDQRRCACASATPTAHTGVPGEWSFNGYDPWCRQRISEPLPLHRADWSQLNSLLGSAELTVAAPSGGSIASPGSTICIATTS